jgi:FkbM family methyltransferase
MSFLNLIKRSVLLDLRFFSLEGLEAIEKFSFFINKYIVLSREIIFKGKKHRKTSVFGRDYYYDDQYGLAFLQSVFIDNAFLEKIIPKRAVILDIGANIGQSNIFYYEYLKALEVYSFEPLPSAYGLLNKNSPQPKNTYNLAVSNSKKITLHVADFSVGASKNVDGRNIKKTVEVEGTSLRDIKEVNNIEKFDLTKIDVQGAEIDVFMSSFDVISRSDFILVEVGLTNESEGNLEEILKILKKDYKLIKVPDVHPFHESFFTWAVDLLFVKRALLPKVLKKLKTPKFSSI